MRYAKARISDPAGYEAGLERVRSHLGPEMRVLEMGCGTGMTARKLARTMPLHPSVAEEVIGLGTWAPPVWKAAA